MALRPQPQCELPNLPVARKSVVAARSLPQGHQRANEGLDIKGGKEAKLSYNGKFLVSRGFPSRGQVSNPKQNLPSCQLRK